MMAKGSPFATFLIIGPTCFFLGILFASFPYDYFVIWAEPQSAPTFPVAPSSSSSGPDDLRGPYITILEQHLKFLHASPPLISRILHIAIGIGISGLLAKLYKPSEANLLFDGASLVLYVLGITVYISNIVKGMRVATAGTYGVPGQDLRSSKFTEEIGAGGKIKQLEPGTEIMGREDSLKVLAASNTILAVILMGVLILQTGQWYAQKKEAAEIEQMDKASAAKKKEREKSALRSTAAGGRTNAKEDAETPVESEDKKQQ